jgi:hypothetical protein
MQRPQKQEQYLVIIPNPQLTLQQLESWLLTSLQDAMSDIVIEQGWCHKLWSLLLFLSLKRSNTDISTIALSQGSVGGW